MKQVQSFSILIWANKARGSSNQFALFARVTVNGKRSEISLKRDVDKLKWDSSACKVKGASLEVRNLNSYISEVKATLYGIYQRMVSNDEFVSAEGIKHEYCGSPKAQKTLLQSLHDHNEDLRKRIGTEVARGTWVKFNTLQKKIKDYLRVYKKRTDIYI